MVDLSQVPVMGRFSGDNPLEWVIQTEKYFIFYDILSEHKLSWASFYLDGEALEWYRWLFRNKQLAGWDHFVDKLFIRFQSRKDPHNRFAFLRQFTTVDDYQARAATISSWSTIPNLPSPQSWNAPLDYNKVKSTRQVFGEKSNKTPDIVVDVENATMLIKSGSAEMLDTQAKEKNFHSISDETKEEAAFPVPQHVSEPLVYNNNEAHKVFDEFSVGCKDVILESHKVLTITTYTIEENDYAIDVGNEDKNEEEEEEKLFTIKNKIQLGPAFVGILPLWIDSTFSTFGDFAMFNMLHKLGITRCLEEMSEMLSTCRYDQLVNRGIIDHFSRLGHASLILTLHLFPPDQFGLAFPFDPGSRSLTMFLRVTRNYVFCVALDNLDPNKLIMSTLWYSCIWVGKGQEQCLPGSLLPKSREFVHISKTTLSYLGFGPGPYLAYDIFAKLPGKTMDVFRQQLYLDEELAPQRTERQIASLYHLTPQMIQRCYTDSIFVESNFLQARFIFQLVWVLLLTEHKLRPSIITGSSLSSIMCYIVATYSWTELQKFIENYLDYIFMEYECGFPVKEFHSYNIKAEISEFIMSAIFVCKIWERLMKNQLRAAQRQNKWMVDGCAGSIKDHILYFANIAQFVLTTFGRERATNVVPYPNLEDKVPIEDGSIVMNLPQPNADTFMNVTQLVIGPRRSNKTGRPLQRLIWDPGPFNN
ncbi:hypothetical protein KY290_007802 [Solanum tuberosum]|uniref:Retrotransposon gag domain-containing protein n=1 Tax=Solanum tuberosum TaxID=4113 RepID=A0ABQ7W6K7_SOLTU|nr:hypothetical protein KY290_007802 [Solanum tuberosum]